MCVTPGDSNDCLVGSGRSSSGRKRNLVWNIWRHETKITFPAGRLFQLQLHVALPLVEEAAGCGPPQPRATRLAHVRRRLWLGVTRVHFEGHQKQ